MALMYTALLVVFCVAPLLALEEDKYLCNTFADYATLRRTNPRCTYNPDIGDNTVNIIKRHGYKSQIYVTMTEDGYILTIIRISTAKKPTKGVVFIQHPYTIGSKVWVDKGNKSVAFNLADMGYDVWLGNSRGTKLSPKHVSLTWRDAKYWDYSFHEIAVYDFPAMLKLVKNATNSRVTFIGYSASGTSAFIFASLLKDVAKDTVDLFVTISPALTLGETFTALSPVIRIITAIIGEVTTQNIMEFVLKFGIRYVPTLIPPLVHILSGITPEELYPPFITLAFHAMADGMNTKQIEHYAQITISKQFRNYVNGEDRQLPEYPLQDIQIPFHIIYGTRDTYFGPKDAQFLYEKLPTSARWKEPYNIGDFNHLDFGYGRNVLKVSEHILQLLEIARNK